MRYLIADTFTKSVARLDMRMRAAAKSAAFDLLTQPDGGGVARRQHRLAHARDTRFWSVRVNRDLRIIVLRTGEQVVLCHVDHHDDAYAWAEQRKLHPHTAPVGPIVEAAEPRPEVLGLGLGCAESLERAPERVEAERAQAGEAPASIHRTPTSRHRAPRRLRMRDRAAAPLPVSTPVRAASAGGTPPLAQLLRAVRAASVPAPPAAPVTAPPAQRELAPGPPRSRRAALLGSRGLIAAAAVAAAISAVAGAVAHDLPLSAAGSAAAVAAVLLASAAAWRLSSASRDALAAVTALRDAVQAGRLEARADRAQVAPEWRAVIGAVNETVNAFARPFSSMAATLTSLARGDVPPRSAERLHGDFERQGAAVDALVEFVMLRPEDIRALVDTAGVPGRLR
jgi:hypothetical protein